MYTNIKLVNISLVLNLTFKTAGINPHNAPPKAPPSIIRGNIQKPEVS